MDQGPLVIDQIDAGARFLGEFQKHKPVQAAFWLKEDDDGERSLYVASREITDDNFDLAYGEVLRVAESMGDPPFDPFQVKLIGVDDPLAEVAMDLQRQHPGRTAPRLLGRTFGSRPVEEFYLYPTPIPVPPTP